MKADDMNGIRKLFNQHLPLLFLMTLFLFTTQFNIIGLQIKSYWFCVLGLALYEILRYGIVRQYGAFLVTLIIAYIYILINQLIFGRFDEFISTQMLSAVLILFSASALVRLYKTAFFLDWRDVIINHIIAAALLNSIVIILSVFSSEFREFFYSIVYITEKASKYLTETAVHTLRYPGFTVSGFSFLSVMTALIVLAAMLHHKFVLGFSNGSNTTTRFLFIILIILTLIFVARTGLLISIVLFVVYLTFFVSYNIRRRNFAMPLIAFFILAAIAGSVLYLFEDYTAFAFELIINYVSGEGFSTTSTDTLKDNEFFFNDDQFLFLFGTGNFGRGHDYIDSDIGWVLFFSGAGAIGTMILYLPLIYLAASGFINRAEPYMKIYMLVSVSLLLLANFKDIYYLSHGYIQPIMLFFAIIVHSKRLHKNSFNSLNGLTIARGRNYPLPPNH